MVIVFGINKLLMVRTFDDRITGALLYVINRPRIIFINLAPGENSTVAPSLVTSLDFHSVLKIKSWRMADDCYKSEFILLNVGIIK